MSRENVEVVRQVYEAAARRDNATVLALYASDVEFDVSRVPMGALIGGGVYRGHDGLRAFFRAWHEAWENIEAEFNELIDAGDDVITVVAAQRARGRASGIESEEPGRAGVWTIRHGKIARVVWFPTRAEALEAVGLSE